MAQVTEFQIREAVAVKAYADPAFRTALKSDAKAAIEGLIKTSLPAKVTVKIVEDSDTVAHFVIPPAASDELSEEQLSAVAGGLMDPLINIGDQNLCLGGGGLVNTKMEINL
jgi:hypothetical protein